MTHTIFVVSLLLLLVSCNKNDACSSLNNQIQKEEIQESASNCNLVEDSSEDDDHAVEDDSLLDGVEGNEPIGDVPQEAQLFNAEINFKNFEINDEDKVYRAIEIIKSVIRSVEFREMVLNFTYNGKKQFKDNEGLSNEEIYQKLLNGAEELKPEIDHQMDLDLQLYYSRKNVVGYTYPSGLRIWMNTKYFDPYTPAQVAGNLFHEWTHKLGFSHSSKYSVSRKSTVPYALGYLIRDLGKKYE